jgi:predicted nucleic acid-binding protein
MGRTNYLIDTNVAIYYFGMALSKESEKYIDQILVDKYYISVINRIELLGFKGLIKNESEALSSFISNAFIFDLEEEIILETINIRKNYSIKLPDAIIAATCLVNGLDILTLNVKDFENIEGLKVIQSESI